VLEFFLPPENRTRMIQHLFATGTRAHALAPRRPEPRKPRGRDGLHGYVCTGAPPTESENWLA
jgi:hypothetical protein